MAHPSSVQRSRWLCALGFLLASGTSCRGGAKSMPADGLDVRWDNTLRYSAGLAPDVSQRRAAGLYQWRRWRPQFCARAGVEPVRLCCPSSISRPGDFGVHASAAAWYDTVYHTHTDNNSPATYNAAVPSPGSSRPAVKQPRRPACGAERCFRLWQFHAGTGAGVRAGRAPDPAWGRKPLFRRQFHRRRDGARRTISKP